MNRSKESMEYSDRLTISTIIIIAMFFVVMYFTHPHIKDNEDMLNKTGWIVLTVVIIIALGYVYNTTEKMMNHINYQENEIKALQQRLKDIDADNQ